MKIERVSYIDYLRLVASVAVVILHVSAQNWYDCGGQGLEWIVFNFYNSIVRWGVPVFVMLSGSLFLSREINIKTLFRKNILRMFIAYCVWSLFYAIVTPFINSLLYNEFDISKTSFFASLIVGKFHMWFIPTIIGLYMCVPVIQQITKDKKVTKYYLTISFIFAFIVPQLVNLSADFVGGLFSYGISLVNKVVSNMNMQLVLGFSFYFILGYALDSIELSKKQRITVYSLGGLGFFFTFLLNGIIAWKTNEPCSTYYDNFTINILFEAIAVHTWFKYRKSYNQQHSRIASKLSKYSFGTYLIHVFVIDVLHIIGLNTIRFSPIISVPIISAITVVISYLITYIINKIPIISKWIT